MHSNHDVRLVTGASKVSIPPIVTGLITQRTHHARSQLSTARNRNVRQTNAFVGATASDGGAAVRSGSGSIIVQGDITTSDDDSDDSKDGEDSDGAGGSSDEWTYDAGASSDENGGSIDGIRDAIPRSAAASASYDGFPVRSSVSSRRQSRVQQGAGGGGSRQHSGASARRGGPSVDATSSGERVSAGGRGQQRREERAIDGIRAVNEVSAVNREHGVGQGRADAAGGQRGDQDPAAKPRRGDGGVAAGVPAKERVQLAHTGGWQRSDSNIDHHGFGGAGSAAPVIAPGIRQPSHHTEPRATSWSRLHPAASVRDVAGISAGGSQRQGRAIQQVPTVGPTPPATVPGQAGAPTAALGSAAAAGIQPRAVASVPDVNVAVSSTAGGPSSGAVITSSPVAAGVTNEHARDGPGSRNASITDVAVVLPTVNPPAASTNPAGASAPESDSPHATGSSSHRGDATQPALVTVTSLASNTTAASTKHADAVVVPAAGAGASGSASAAASTAAGSSADIPEHGGVFAVAPAAATNRAPEAPTIPANATTGAAVAAAHAPVGQVAVHVESGGSVSGGGPGLHSAVPSMPVSVVATAPAVAAGVAAVAAVSAAPVVHATDYARRVNAQPPSSTFGMQRAGPTMDTDPELEDFYRHTRALFEGDEHDDTAKPMAMGGVAALHPASGGQVAGSNGDGVANTLATPHRVFIDSPSVNADACVDVIKQILHKQCAWTRDQLVAFIANTEQMKRQPEMQANAATRKLYGLLHQCQQYPQLRSLLADVVTQEDANARAISRALKASSFEAMAPLNTYGCKMRCLQDRMTQAIEAADARVQSGTEAINARLALEQEGDRRALQAVVDTWQRVVGTYSSVLENAQSLVCQLATSASLDVQETREACQSVTALIVAVRTILAEAMGALQHIKHPRADATGGSGGGTLEDDQSGGRAHGAAAPHAGAGTMTAGSTTTTIAVNSPDDLFHAVSLVHHGIRDTEAQVRKLMTSLATSRPSFDPERVAQLQRTLQEALADLTDAENAVATKQAKLEHARRMEQQLTTGGSNHESNCEAARVVGGMPSASGSSSLNAATSAPPSVVGMDTLLAAAAETAAADREYATAEGRVQAARKLAELLQQQMRDARVQEVLTKLDNVCAKQTRWLEGCSLLVQVCAKAEASLSNKYEALRVQRRNLRRDEDDRLADLRVEDDKRRLQTCTELETALVTIMGDILRGAEFRIMQGCQRRQQHLEQAARTAVMIAAAVVPIPQQDAVAGLLQHFNAAYRELCSAYDLITRLDVAYLIGNVLVHCMGAVHASSTGSQSTTPASYVPAA